jgi:MFS family permease
VPHQHPFWELLLAYVCLVLSNSVLYGGPVFRAAAATAMGWSQEAATGAFALGFLVVIPMPFLAGWVADRWGARLVVAGGTLLAALGLLGAAAGGALWQWYVTAGGLLSIGCSSVFNGVSLLAATRQRRGTVLGINASATGLGLALGAPLMQVLLQAYGWRATLGYAGLTLALLALVVSHGVSQPWHRDVEHFSPPRVWSPLPPEPSQRRRLAGFFVGYVLVAFYDESVYQHVYAYGRSLGLSDLAAASLVSVTSSAYIAGGVTGASCQMCSADVPYWCWLRLARPLPSRAWRIVRPTWCGAGPPPSVLPSGPAWWCGLPPLATSLPAPGWGVRLV